MQAPTLTLEVQSHIVLLSTKFLQVLALSVKVPNFIKDVFGLIYHMKVKASTSSLNRYLSIDKFLSSLIWFDFTL